MAIEYEWDETGKYSYLVCDHCSNSSDRFIKTIDDEYLCKECFKESLPQMITFTPYDEEILKFYYEDEWQDEDAIDSCFFADSENEADILCDIAEKEYERQFDY